MAYSLADIAAMIQDDYQYIDGLQTVTYYVRTNDTVGGFSETTYTATALKRENNKRSITGSDNSAVADHEASWSIWVHSQSSPFVPKLGDKFTATGISGSQTWLVLDVDYCDFTTRYRLRCKQKTGN